MITGEFQNPQIPEKKTCIKYFLLNITYFSGRIQCVETFDHQDAFFTPSQINTSTHGEVLPQRHTCR